MKYANKSESAYKTIGEATRDLGLIDKNTGNPQTHTLRYWETQFKQIKPSVKAGNRRYYSPKDLQIIKNIKFLLKDRGFTINGVKKILNSNKTLPIDADTNVGIYKRDLKTTKSVKNRLKKITRIISELKEYK